jgi:gluconokinase
MTVLILDIGSSSTRAMLFDDDARLIPGALVSEATEIMTHPPGAAVLDALDLRARVETCLDTLLQHPMARDIRAVGMCTLVGNMLGVDSAGEPVTPIYTYADNRSGEDAAYLKTVIEEASIHQRTGCMIHTAYQPARLHWLRRTEPDTFNRTAMWMDFATYLYGAWFGSWVCSHSVASWTGMLNRADLGWSRQWLDVLQMNAQSFPQLGDYADMQRGLTGEYAARWPALRDVPFCLAVGDGAAANVGCGCVDENRIALTVGSTAALRIVTREILPTVPPGLWGYRVDDAHHLIGGATTEGGNIFEWAKETLRLDDPQEIESALMSRVPDSHGLTFLPLLAGERSPGWASSATGSLLGLRLSTTPIDIVQAAMEGVALRLSLVCDQLAQLVPPDSMVMAGGGALSASPAWAHMVANALNRPMQVIGEKEVTAHGVAILTLYAINHSSLSAHPPEVAYTIEPIPAVVDILRAARERQQELYDKFILGE